MPTIGESARPSHAFGPDEIRVLSDAFADALRVLGLPDRIDPVASAVAKRIIDLAQLGERDPIRLRDYAVGINQQSRAEELN
jgi:hypothetical protein